MGHANRKKAEKEHSETLHDILYFMAVEFELKKILQTMQCASGAAISKILAAKVFLTLFRGEATKISFSRFFGVFRMIFSRRGY